MRKCFFHSFRQKTTTTSHSHRRHATAYIVLSCRWVRFRFAHISVRTNQCLVVHALHRLHACVVAFFNFPLRFFFRITHLFHSFIRSFISGVFCFFFGQKQAKQPHRIFPPLCVFFFVCVCVILFS